LPVPIPFSIMKSKILTVLILSILVFILSAIPYLIAEYKTPSGRSFSGQVAYVEDQKMYFSFIRQAYDGKWAFNNRLTHLRNSDVFINLQFLLIGRIMRVFHLSENVIYEVWRFLGALLAIGGFAFLASLFGLSKKRWLFALLMFGAGGGFGIFPVLAGAAHLIHIPKTLMSALSLDLWSGLHPFQQILANPNFSLPHGLMLFGFSFFLVAEQRRKFFYYCVSGLIFAVNGFVRPYDLITVAALFPLYSFIKSHSAGFDAQQLFRRLLPVLCILPVFGYHIWLFKFNAIFKYWSSQGHNVQSLAAPWWYYFSFGLAGILAMLRIIRVKKQPLLPNEIFLVLWFGMISILKYAGLVVPGLGFSSQIAVPIIAPLILLGMALRDTAFLGLNIRSGIGKRLAIAAIGLSIVIGAAGPIFFFGMRVMQSNDPAVYYVNAEELTAWKWMNTNLEPEEVVLAMPNTSMNIGKYTSLRTITGHYSVTPEYKKNKANVVELFTAHLRPWARKRLRVGRAAARRSNPDEKISGFMKEYRVAYLYLGPAERIKSIFAIKSCPWLEPVYKNSTVLILKVNR